MWTDIWEKVSRNLFSVTFFMGGIWRYEKLTILQITVVIVSRISFRDEVSKTEFRSTHNTRMVEKKWLDSCLGVTQTVTFSVECDSIQNDLGDLLRFFGILQFFNCFRVQDFVTGFGLEFNDEIGGKRNVNSLTFSFHDYVKTSEMIFFLIKKTTKLSIHKRPEFIRDSLRRQVQDRG